MEAQDERSVPSTSTPSRGALTGIRVIELADEQAEYCGLTLAGLGADVVKVEPPAAAPRAVSVPSTKTGGPRALPVLLAVQPREALDRARSAPAGPPGPIRALFHRARTGEGQWIDASQSEVGLFINGTTILDWSAHGRIWSRYGNRSPYKPAAPHGVYPCVGEDRWRAIACFTGAEWRALSGVAGHLEWAEDCRFGDLAGRLLHQDALDALVGQWTKSQDAYEAMLRLQLAGVPAGVCQTAEDRCDHDPQLAELAWLTEVTGTKIGRWPIAEVPVKMSESPAYIGGRIDRGAPCYGEDNHYVYGDLLGMSSQEIDALAAEGVI